MFGLGIVGKFFFKFGDSFTTDKSSITHDVLHGGINFALDALILGF
jgi:hypothetical protein